MTTGEHYSVTVTKILERGAVVQINGTDKTAFIHISKVAPEFVQNIAEYLEVGQTYDAECLEPDKPELSLKHLKLKSKFKEQDVKRPAPAKKQSLDDMIAKMNAAYAEKQRKSKGAYNTPPRKRRGSNKHD